MRMKQRWIGGMLLGAALTLGACAPPDAGAEEESVAPTADPSDEPSVEASAEAASPTPTPTPTLADDY